MQAASAGSKAAAGKQPQQQWRYKYKRQPCPSLCSTDDMLCQEVEALIQNVLSFPNMPARIHRALPIIKADISSMTALVEQMARHFGKELTLCYIRKQPHLLSLDFDTVMSRCNSIRDLFGIRDSDIPQMLRKCPHLVMLDTQQARAAYDNIPRVIKFTPLQVGGRAGCRLIESCSVTSVTLHGLMWLQTAENCTCQEALRCSSLVQLQQLPVINVTHT